MTIDDVMEVIKESNLEDEVKAELKKIELAEESATELGPAMGVLRPKVPLGNKVIVLPNTPIETQTPITPPTVEIRPEILGCDQAVLLKFLQNTLLTPFAR